jgi:hypothetical protein
VSTKEQLRSPHPSAHAHAFTRKISQSTRTIQSLRTQFPHETHRALCSQKVHAQLSHFQSLNERVCNSQKTIAFKFLHSHTHAHSFPGSPVLSGFYELDTGGVYTLPHRHLEVSLEISPAPTANPMPSIVCSRHLAPGLLRTQAAHRPPRNRISRAKIKTALAAPVTSGNRFGLAATLPRPRSFGRSAHKL